MPVWVTEIMLICVFTCYGLHYFWGILFTGREQESTELLLKSNQIIIIFYQKTTSPQLKFIFQVVTWSHILVFLNVRLYRLVKRVFAKCNQCWIVLSAIYDLKVLETSGFGIQLHVNITKYIPGTTWLLSITSSSYTTSEVSVFPYLTEFKITAFTPSTKRKQCRFLYKCKLLIKGLAGHRNYVQGGKKI